MNCGVPEISLIKAETVRALKCSEQIFEFENQLFSVTLIVECIWKRNLIPLHICILLKLKKSLPDRSRGVALTRGLGEKPNASCTYEE